MKTYVHTMTVKRIQVPCGDIRQLFELPEGYRIKSAELSRDTTTVEFTYENCREGDSV